MTSEHTHNSPAILHFIGIINNREANIVLLNQADNEPITWVDFVISLPFQNELFRNLIPKTQTCQASFLDFRLKDVITNYRRKTGR